MLTTAELTFTIICLSIPALANAAAAARVRKRMSEATFTIGYDGPAVENGEMDVRDLAPAMLATADLFTEANSHINGTRATVNVNITTRRAGSIDIVLQIIQQTASGSVDLFSSEEAIALATASTLAKLIFDARGLVSFFKNTQGKPAEKVEPIPDDKVRVTVEGGSIAVARTIHELSKKRSVHDSMDDLIKTPLQREGITEFRSTYDGHTEKVTEEESAFFSVPSQVVSQNESKRWYTIVRLTLEGNKKWELTDGSATISVTIADQQFLDRVERRLEHFIKGDRLHCTVYEEQTDTRSGLRTEYTVLKVHDHSHERVQLPFPSDDTQ